MASGSIRSLGSIGGVAVGLAVLLIGVASHGGQQLQIVGGVIVLLGVAVLAMHLSKLETPTEPTEKE